MQLQSVLNKSVSIQPNAWSPISGEMTIGEVLEDIKIGKYNRQIEALRAYILNGQTEQYNVSKKRLPAVTFCGSFGGQRKRDLLKEYNSIVVLDIDKLVGDELERVKAIVQDDKFVFASWISPSNNGVKGLVFISYNYDVTRNVDNAHKVAFSKIKGYFSKCYNIYIDESGSDTTRLCFLSFDKDINIKDSIEPFVINEMPDEIIKQSNSVVQINRYISDRDALFNPLNRNKETDRRAIQNIIKYLSKKKLSITSSYDEWYRVALAISNTFTYEIGLKYFLKLCQMDIDKFDAGNCENMLIYAYHNGRDNISFGTIEYFAAQRGFINKGRAVPKGVGES